MLTAPLVALVLSLNLSTLKPHAQFKLWASCDGLVRLIDSVNPGELAYVDKGNVVHILNADGKQTGLRTIPKDFVPLYLTAWGDVAMKCCQLQYLDRKGSRQKNWRPEDLFAQWSFTFQSAGSGYLIEPHEVEDPIKPVSSPFLSPASYLMKGGIGISRNGSTVAILTREGMILTLTRFKHTDGSWRQVFPPSVPQMVQRNNHMRFVPDGLPVMTYGYNDVRFVGESEVVFIAGVRPPVGKDEVSDDLSQEPLVVSPKGSTGAKYDAYLFWCTLSEVCLPIAKLQLTDAETPAFACGRISVSSDMKWLYLAVGHKIWRAGLPLKLDVTSDSEKHCGIKLPFSQWRQE